MAPYGATRPNRVIDFDLLILTTAHLDGYYSKASTVIYPVSFMRRGTTVTNMD